MNLIFKDNCPICLKPLNHKRNDDNLFTYIGYYSCKETGCYQLYEDPYPWSNNKSIYSRHVIVYVPTFINPKYIIQYFINADNTATEIDDSSAMKIMGINHALPINWDNLEETANKISTLIVFS